MQDRLLFAGLHMHAVPENGVVVGENLLPQIHPGTLCKCMVCYQHYSV